MGLGGGLLGAVPVAVVSTRTRGEGGGDTGCGPGTLGSGIPLTGLPTIGTLGAGAPAGRAAVTGTLGSGMT